MDQATYDAAATILYKDDYEGLPDGAVKDLYKERQNSMPTGFEGNDNTATAKKSDDKKLKVSVNEYAANFKDLTIYRSDLAFNPDTKKMEGEFVYKITEVIPANAEETEDYVEDAEGKKFYYYVVNDGKGNNIKYTSEEHFVTIKAVDEGSGNITTTVTYDGRKSGEYVPVYTNYALMPTPITGTKTWVGGKESEHVNGKVTLNANNTQIVKTEATAEEEATPKDDLGLKLTRKLPGEQDYSDVTEDDGGRPLVIIWAKEKRTPHTIESYFESDDPAVVVGKTYYTHDEETDTYDAVTNTEGKSPSGEGWFEMTEVIEYSFEYEKQETGNGIYTIKAVVTKDGETTYVDPLLKTVDDDGNEYDYKIDETDVPDKYKESINGLDVTNTYKITDNLKVTKTWDDAQDAEGLRPDKVIVHLYKEVIVPATTEGGDATTKTVQVEVDKKTIKYDEAKDPDEHTWATGVVFDDLPLYDSNGNVIKYFVLEEGIAGYTGTYAANSTDDDDYKDADHLVKVDLDGDTEENPDYIDIKNSLSPATNKVEVTKHWDDNNNCDGQRPKDVTFKLYKYVWKDATDSTPAGYGDKELVSGTGNDSSGRPAVKADVDAEKAEKVGDTIKFDHLVLDGKEDNVNTTGYEIDPVDENTWKGEWINLPLTENGNTIIYVIEEDTNGDKYADPGTEGKYSKNPCISGDQFAGYNVKNTYTPVTITFEGDKVWEDDGRTHDNTTELKGKFILHRDWEVTTEEDDQQQTNTYPVNVAPTEEMSELPIEHYENIPFLTYKLKEGHNSMFGDTLYKLDFANIAEDHLIRDNQYAMEDPWFTLSEGTMININPQTDGSVDPDDYEQLRSRGLFNGLFNKLGRTRGTTTKKYTEVVEDYHIDWDGNKFTIIDIPKYHESGAVYTYWLQEVQIDGYKMPVYSEGDEVYSLKFDEADQVYRDDNSIIWVKDGVVVTGDNRTGSTAEGIKNEGTITNTLETGMIFVEKWWDDQNDADGVRKNTKTKVSLWKKVWDPEQDKYDDEKIEKVNGTIGAQGGATSGDDSMKRDVPTGYQGSETPPTKNVVDVVETGNSYAWNNLPVYETVTYTEDGDTKTKIVKIPYVVIEDDIDGYVTTYTCSERDIGDPTAATYYPLYKAPGRSAVVNQTGYQSATLDEETTSIWDDTAGDLVDVTANTAYFAIRNQRTPKVGEVVVEKEWEDTVDGVDYSDSYRPATLTATLTATTASGKAANIFTADGSIDRRAGTKNTKTITLTKASDWAKQTVSGLPDTYEGEAINYTVTENVPDAYELKATNKTAKYSDETSAPYTYDLDDPTDATSTQLTYEFTNKLETVKFVARKVWVDGDPDEISDDLMKGSSRKYRPAKITIQAKDGDTVIREKDIAKDTSLATQHVEFELPKYSATDKTNPVTWTVDEKTVPANYEKTVAAVPIVNLDTKAYIITNRLKATDFTGTKVWEDDGRDHNNPKELNGKLTLHRDWTTTVEEQKVQKTEPVGKFNSDDVHVDWDGDSFTIIGLPEYNDKGEQYTYWVSEAQIGTYEEPAYGDNTKQHKTTDAETSEEVVDGITDGGTITNTQLLDIKVSKKWNDDNNLLDSRGEKGDVTVTLWKKEWKIDTDPEGYTEWTKVETKTVPIDNSNTVVETWEDQPSYKNGKKVLYKLTEENAGDKTVLNDYVTTYKQDGTSEVTSGREAEFDISNSVTGDDGQIYALTYDNTYNKTDSIKVTKTWDDKSNAEGLRPDPQKVIVHLYKKVSDGEQIKTVQVEVEKKEITKQEGDTYDVWSKGITWDNLPVFGEDGKRIKYVVVEETLYGYKTTYSLDGGDYKDDVDNIELDGETGAQTVDVKNSLTPAVTEIPVTKVWDDMDNIDGKRPEDGITFTLYERVWDKTLNNNKGGYKPEAEATLADGTEVDKLVLNGIEDPDQTEDVKELAPTNYNTWNGVFGGLAATKGGKTVIYYVKETPNPVSSDYEEAYVTGNQVDGFSVTNKRKQDTVSTDITKVWNDNNNALNTRPDTLTIELWRAYLDENDEYKYEKVITDINGYKIKHMMSDDDVPEGDTSGNKWKLAYDNLPKNRNVGGSDNYQPVPEQEAIPKNEGWYEKDGETYKLTEDEYWHDDKTYYRRITTDKVSTPYTYYWKETIPTGYTATVNPTTDPTEGFTPEETLADNIQKAVGKDATITNEFITGKLTLVKTWNDDDNVDDIRPTTTDYLNNKLVLFANKTKIDDFGNAPPKVKKSITQGTGENKNKNKYTVTYENLPIYDKNGQKISYTVEEKPIEGYSHDGTPELTDTLDETPADSGNYEGEMSVTNKHVPGTTSLTVTKVWDDDNNKDGKRPTVAQLKAALKLYADGSLDTAHNTAEYDADYKQAYDNGDGTYTVIWNNLPAKKNVTSKGTTTSEYILYSAKEDGAADNEVFAYYDSYDAANGPAYDNTDASGAGIDAVKKAEKDKAYNGGKITNKQVLQDIEVRKVWVDKVNSSTDPDATTDDTLAAEGVRPDSITLKLMNGTTEAKADTIDENTGAPTTTAGGIIEGSWSEQTFTYRFVKVPIYDADNKQITYTVDENDVPNYSKSIIDTLGAMTVVNTYKMASVTGTKIWQDGYETKHDTSEELKGKLKLYRKAFENPDGDEETVNNPHIDWDGNTYTIQNLPEKDSAGYNYTYWVVEDTIDGYEEPVYDNSTASGAGIDADKKAETNKAYNGGKIINRKLIEIEVSKIWNDNDNAEEKRAATTVKLEQKDGSNWKTAKYYDETDDEWKDVEQGTVGIEEDEFKVIEWSNLAAVDTNGNAIKYRVIEDKVEGYVTTYTGEPKSISGDGNVVELDASDLASTDGKASITFKNTYGNVISSPTDEDVDLFKSYKEKNDQGDVINLEGKEFEYELKGNAKGTDDSTQDARNLTAEGANEAQTAGEDTAPIKIEQIGFNKLGTYSFTLTEKVPDPKTPGVTFDETSYNLLATVKADTENNDEWIVEWKIVSKKVGDTVTQISDDPDAHSATFKNYYDDLKKEVVPEVTKELSGHKIGGSYKFEFVLFGGPDDKPVSGLDENEKLEGETTSASMDPDTKKATEVVPLNKDGGKLSFTLDDLKKLDGSYETSRTFTYLVYEKGGDAKGVIYDTTPKELKVTLTYVAAGTEQDDASTTDVDESKEHLKVTFKPAGAGTAGAANTGIKFENEYNPDATQSSVTDDYTVKKEIIDLNNKDREPRNEEFTFRLKGQDKGPEEDAQDARHIDMLAVNDANGNVEFPKAAFTKPGTYTFKMTELNPYDDTVDPYDSWERTAKAIVTDEGDGSMKVVWTVTAEEGAPKAVDEAEKLVTFVNKTVPETVDKPVRVSWVNDTDADDTVGTDRDDNDINVVKDRPKEITVTLQAEQDVYSYDGKDYTTFEDLMKAVPEGTTEDVVRDAIENKTPIGGKTITTGKKWVDVTKKADGSVVQSSITLDKTKNLDGDPNNWGDIDTWTGLPKYDENGKKIEYRIIQSGYELPDGTKVEPRKAGEGGEEDSDGEKIAGGSTMPAAIPGYGSSAVSVPGTNLTTFVNLYETTTITGTKTWVDADPTAHNNSSEVKLKVERRASDSDTWKTLVENEDYHVDWTGTNDATFTIKGLTKYVDKSNTTQYQYRVSENPVPTGYSVTYKADGASQASETPLDKDGGEIINTADTIEMIAVKVWAGDEDNPGGRDNVKFQIYREIGGAKKKLSDDDLPDGQSAEQTVAKGSVHEDDMTATWENLPAVNGSKAVTYTVEEVAAPAGYESSSKTEYGYTEDGEDKWSDTKPDNWNKKIKVTITNTLKDTTVDVPVRKVWVDNDDQDGERPGSIKARVYIDKNDNGEYDNDEQVKVEDGKLDPSGTIVADLELKDSNNWKRIFSKLPATDSRGNAVTYKIAEVDASGNVIDGSDGNNTMDGKKTKDKYTVSIKADQPSGYVITNSSETELVTVEATKVWVGDDAVKETTRKDVTLYLIGRTSEDKEAAVAYDGGSIKIKVNETIDATARWENLPKHIDGTELIWEVYEDVLPGYTMKLTQTTGTGGKTAKVGDDNLAKFDVTNTYVGAVKKVEAVKVWDDDDNRDGMRDDIKLVLWRQVGNEDPEKVDTKTISKDATGDDLKVKWTKLPEMKTITKTTTETQEVPKYVEVDEPQNSPADNEYYELVDGKYVPSEDATVDSDKTYYIQDGTEEIDVDVETEETHAIVYWVAEEDVPDGYTSVVTQTEPGKFEAVNIHVPETTKVAFTKVWNDGEDSDGIRPDHIVVTLKDGNDVIETVKLTDEDAGWNEGVTSTKPTEDKYYVITGLPKYKDGEQISYSVYEKDITDYLPSIVEDETPVVAGASQTFTIVNTHTPGETIDVKVVKEWKGDEADKSTRQDVKVQLIEVVKGYRKKIGEEVTLTFDPENPDKEMSHTWKDLAEVQEGGAPITYEVTETEVDGYTMTGNVVEEDEDGNLTITITNEYVEVIPAEDVIYVDPKNPEGQMILKSDKYPTPAEAKSAAQNKTNAPGNPSHKDGSKFIGWAVNYDEKGNWVLVAQYKEKEPDPVVSYVDPQTGKIVTGIKGKVKKPADPKAKNMQFVKWVETTDAAGNTIYVAQYECDCSNGGGKGVDKSNVDTGDDAMLTVWMLLFVMAMSFMILTMMIRSRNINAVRDNYRPKH